MSTLPDLVSSFQKSFRWFIYAAVGLLAGLILLEILSRPEATWAGFLQLALAAGGGLAGGAWLRRLLGRSADCITTLHQERRQFQDFHQAFSGILERIKNGDLTVRVDQLQEFEQYRRFGETLVHTIHNFTETLLKIQKTSYEVTSQAHCILETSGEQASGASEQAAAVAQITSAMEELARTAAQIAENTSRVVKFSEESETRALEGAEHMKEGQSSMERMNQRMNDINENAHQLGEKFQEIDKILALITSIASDTHILALNAAIEAASAGEFGARFSVIASEVRRLSDMSSDAVDEIKRILVDFQKSIQRTILATEQGTKEFITARDAAVTIQDRLEVITQHVSQTTRAAKEISLATQQQKSASDQIVETLKDISVVTREIANALQQFNQAANRLNTLALEMQLISQNFTVASERNIKYLALQTAARAEIRDYRTRNIHSSFEEILAKYPFMELVFIAETDGTLCNFEVPPHLQQAKNASNVTTGVNLSHRPWFYAAFESGQPYITNMYKSMITQEDCFTISAPILDDEQKIIGILGIDINANNWAKLA